MAGGAAEWWRSGMCFLIAQTTLYFNYNIQLYLPVKYFENTINIEELQILNETEEKIMQKPSNKKVEQSKEGPGKASSSPEQEMPHKMNEEKDPPNWAVLAAIMALCNEVTQIKSDICAAIDIRFVSVFADLREAVTTDKQNPQASISVFETTLASQSNTIIELEKSATTKSDLAQFIGREANLKMWR